MRSVVFSSILTCLIAFLVISCTPQTSVVALHKSIPKNVNPYKRLLVVHVSDDRAQRQDFEDALLGELRRQDVDAVAGHGAGVLAGNGDSGELIAAARGLDADAILQTKFISITTETEVTEGRTDIRSQCRGGDLEDYFLYDYEVVTEPVTMKIVHDVVAVSSLVDVASGESLWSIQSTCLNRSSMAEILADEASTIVAGLADDGLIR